MKRFWTTLVFLLLMSLATYSTAFASSASSSKVRRPVTLSRSMLPNTVINDFSNNGPSIVASCSDIGGYAGIYTGTDSRINMYANFASGADNVISSASSNFTPASACWQGDIWTAYTNLNGGLYVSKWFREPLGFWDLTASSIPPEAVDYAPAIVACQNNLYIGWVGTLGANTSNHYLNIMQYNIDNPSASSVKTLTDYTRSGVGLALACLNNQVYVSWLASSGTPHFYLGVYQPGNSQLQHSGPITTTDYAATHPAMSASNSGQLEFLWKADTDNRLFATLYTPFSGSWSNGTPQSGMATLYTPSADHAFTAYIGTDHRLNIDQGVIFP